MSPMMSPILPDTAPPDPLFADEASWPLLETAAADAERALARFLRQRATQADPPASVTELNTAASVLTRLITARKALEKVRHERENPVPSPISTDPGTLQHLLAAANSLPQEARDPAVGDPARFLPDPDDPTDPDHLDSFPNSPDDEDDDHDDPTDPDPLD